MITKVSIKGYRKFAALEFSPREGLNVLVGANDSGKSTIVEAMCLALTCRINGKPAREELNPHWFNKNLVEAFFLAVDSHQRPAPPSICIEIYFADEDDLLSLHGAHNSQPQTTACPGVSLSVELDEACTEDFWEFIEAGNRVLPVEFYLVKWRSFRDTVLATKPKAVSVAVIDGRTLRSTSAVDYYMRQTLNANLSDPERQRVSTAFRAVKEEMTAQHLEPINQRLQSANGLQGGDVSLAMDQTSRTGWESIISPHVEGLPFSLAGHGRQAHVKIALAMGAHDSTRIIFVEEPENHQSHTSLGELMNALSTMRSDNQQVFVVTHSSFVLNRLGTNTLVFVGDSTVTAFQDLTADTASYFRKLPGYDTLRIVLARKVVLVEGPSDEIVFQRFYSDRHDRLPIADGIDVVSMGGVSPRRGLELCKQIGRKCAVLRDLDKQTPEDIRTNLGDLLETGHRQLFVGRMEDGTTLEPQILAANADSVLRDVLQVHGRAELERWMSNNKTEAAIRILDSSTSLRPPTYVSDAIDFIHG